VANRQAGRAKPSAAKVPNVTIVRVGATKKYSDGWESAFSKGKKKPANAAKASAKKSPAKASAKKKSGGKKKGKK
jgi:hypothetical protein